MMISVGRAMMMRDSAAYEANQRTKKLEAEIERLHGQVELQARQIAVLESERNTLVKEVRRQREKIDDLLGASMPEGIARLHREIARLNAKADTWITTAGRYAAALDSIAKNTCCDRCQEAALVAQSTLKGGKA